jgi:anti-sigma factor RsiW
MGERIEAYHDGELSGLARRRLERELRRSPELRGELEGLASLREALQELDAQGPEPDLWDHIALRLPAADARRAEAAEGGAPSWLWGWLRPATALAAATVVALGVVAVLYWPVAPEAGRVVRWLDSGDRNVMVIDDDPSTTIIWVLDSLGEGAGRGERRETV